MKIKKILLVVLLLCFTFSLFVFSISAEYSNVPDIDDAYSAFLRVGTLKRANGQYTITYYESTYQTQIAVPAGFNVYALFGASNRVDPSSPSAGRVNPLTSAMLLQDGSSAREPFLLHLRSLLDESLCGMLDADNSVLSGFYNASYNPENVNISLVLAVLPGLTNDGLSSLASFYRGEGYSEGYDGGYSEGYISGYDGGYSEGYDRGESDGVGEGYSVGERDALNSLDNTKSLWFTILDAPFAVVRQGLNFEILGVNIASLAFFLLTSALIVILIKRFKA